jgi:hypothetical protein
MPGTVTTAEDTLRSFDNGARSAPITPLLSEKLRGHSPEIQQRVRDVISRKAQDRRGRA